MIAGFKIQSKYLLQNVLIDQQSFKDLSEHSKRRKTQDIREHIDIEEMIFATQMKLRAQLEM